MGNVTIDNAKALGGVYLQIRHYLNIYDSPFFLLGHRVVKPSSGEVEAYGFISAGRHFCTCILGRKFRLRFPYAFEVPIDCDVFNLSVHEISQYNQSAGRVYDYYPKPNGSWCLWVPLEAPSFHAPT